MLDINNTLGWNLKSPQRSILRLQGSNASTPATTRYYTNIVQQIGNSLQYVRDQVRGDTITVIGDGLYFISLSDTFSAPAYAGVSVNGDPYVDITSLPQANILCSAYHPNANVNAPMSVLAVLKNGDVIRSSCTANAPGGNIFQQTFLIVKVSD